MGRLIDADALIEEIQYYIDEAGWGIAHNEALNWCIEFIENSPTVEERETGKWVHLGGDEWCCDKCGFVITTEGSWEHPHDIGANHCQNCGAKMEAEP